MSRDLTHYSPPVRNWTPGPWRIEPRGRKCRSFAVLADPEHWRGMTIFFGVGEALPNRTLEMERANAALARYCARTL